MTRDETDPIERLIAEGKITPARRSMRDPFAWEPIELASGKSVEELIAEDREGRY